MNDLYYSLRTKGWTKKEIQRATQILQSTEKPAKIKILDAIIYWFVLFVAIFGNLIISIALVPFLLQFRSVFLYTIIAVLAAVFGFLFDLLIRDIETIQKKHVIIAGLFIPALAIINIYYITSFSNHVSSVLQLGNSHNPISISFIYVIAFISPYFLYKISHKEPIY
ncbi:MAG TPA: hypothetical protein VJH97_02070 [Candidatus Nanoarchaeia archaeon]|nr:hypothetical protein [Candidatus Nanoarchaeia archaeon]